MRSWAGMLLLGIAAADAVQAAHPMFRWPLRASGGHAEPGFSMVFNHVDHDPAFPDALRDYNCGTRTYDRDDGANHPGTDIVVYPDTWNLMLSGRIEVVAAAPGTLVRRVDGNRDLSCRRNIGAPRNEVWIRHDDGSEARYLHLRLGTVTTKPVGSSIAAGEYLGKVGASGNVSLPHVHVEIRDAGGRLIDPFAGACNFLNVDSWWAEQRPYTDTRMMAVATATAPPSEPVCGDDGFLVDPGSYHRRDAFARGDLVYLIGSVQDMPVGGSIRYEVRDPSGSLAFTRENTPAAEAQHATYRFASFRLPSTAALGTWMVEASLGGTKAQAAFSVSADGQALANYTDLWWNPAESGWGVNLNHQGEQLFATWFAYDADGEPLWLVMSDGRAQAGGFAGTLYRTTGTPFGQIDGRPAVLGAPAAVGNASFRFTDRDHGTFTYTVNGVTQAKAIERQRFAAAASCAATRGTRLFATNYQDLWWQPAESGWGINLAHQGETIFATWFTYGAGGRGTWYVASDVRRQPTGEFRGRLYRTRGVPFDRVAGTPAASGPPADVGEVTLTFLDGENGRFDYSVGGVAGSKAIVRQVFAPAPTLCR